MFLLLLQFLELLLQLLQRTFLLADLGLALFDGFFQLFLFGHDISPCFASEWAGNSRLVTGLRFLSLDEITDKPADFTRGTGIHLLTEFDKAQAFFVVDTHDELAVLLGLAFFCHYRHHHKKKKLHRRWIIGDMQTGYWLSNR